MKFSSTAAALAGMATTTFAAMIPHAKSDCDSGPYAALSYTGADTGAYWCDTQYKTGKVVKVSNQSLRKLSSF